jgi:thymidylate synthase ThyX
MGYACKVICDSITAGSDVRLTTLEIAFPRIVLAEFNTHRQFSRNSASSRAIPVEKRIAAVEADPFIPEQFGRNQRGMQAGEALEGEEARAALEVWELAIEDAINRARLLARRGVHKQLANRLIEPFCWHTVVVTATEWSNFFGLRCNPAAQPEIQTIAGMMRTSMQESSPSLVGLGGWHLPYVRGYEDVGYVQPGAPSRQWARISAARCARVSYLTHEGAHDPAADLLLADKLEAPGHMSPFEHPAFVCEGHGEWIGNFRAPWHQLRKLLPNEADFSKREQ